MADTPIIHALESPDDGRHLSESFSIASGATTLVSDAQMPKSDGLISISDNDHQMTDSTTDDSHQLTPPITIFGRFFDLDPKLQIKILAFAEACPVGHWFRPFYKQGMRKAYMSNRLAARETCFDESWKDVKNTYVTRDNVDFLESAFVSKEYAARYIETFYSHNTFTFGHPRAANWFFKALGKRFQCLRKVELFIHPGLGENYDVHPGLGGDYKRLGNFLTETLEELWFGVLCWMEHKHRFEHLYVAFLRSPGDYELSRLSEDSYDEMVEFREKIVQRFSRPWGIKKVILRDPSLQFFQGQQDLYVTELSMQQTRTDVHVDKRKATLEEVMQKIRDEQMWTAQIMADDIRDVEGAAAAGITVEEARNSRLAMEELQQNSFEDDQAGSYAEVAAAAGITPEEAKESDLAMEELQQNSYGDDETGLCSKPGSFDVRSISNPERTIYALPKSQKNQIKMQEKEDKKGIEPQEQASQQSFFQRLYPGQTYEDGQRGKRSTQSTDDSMDVDASTSSSTITVTRLNGSRYSYSSPKTDDARADYDRPSDLRVESRGKGGRPRNNHYGRKQYDFADLR